MENQTIKEAFSARLIAGLKEKGLASNRSHTGVSHIELSKIIGKPIQVVPFIVSGERIPDAETIVAIAKWLKVSPGWLLFGESSEHIVDSIVIEESLLEEILDKALALDHAILSTEKFSKFVRDIIIDTATLDANLDIKRKMIERAFKSVGLFNQSNTSKEIL
jgi:transcriptional regulator with XRE-family HTH domain